MSPGTTGVQPKPNRTIKTPELLEKNGIRYMCDWVNDDMPYSVNTGHGPLVALPLSTELEDTFVLMNNQHSEQSYVEQVQDACGFLLREADTKGGRLLALSIHPWLMGQPHRIGKLDAMLAHITSQNGIWSAPASEIIAKAGL